MPNYQVQVTDDPPLSSSLAVVVAEVGQQVPAAGPAPGAELWANFRPGSSVPDPTPQRAHRGPTGAGKGKGRADKQSGEQETASMVRAFTSLLRFGGSAKDRPFREHLDVDGWATMEALAAETSRSVDEVRAFLDSAGIFDIRGNEVRIPGGKTGYRQSSARGSDERVYGVFGPPGQTAEAVPPFVPPVAEPT